MTFPEFIAFLLKTALQLRRKPGIASALFLTTVLATPAWVAAAPGTDPAIVAAFANGQISTHRGTGMVRFLGHQAVNAIRLKRVPGAGAPRDYGFAFAVEYGTAFGVRDPATQLKLLLSKARTGGGNRLRYRQVHRGVPVFGGELVINLDRGNALLSMNGEIAPGLTLGITPTLSAAAARAIALQAVSKWYGIDPSELAVSVPELNIYDARLLKPSFLPPGLVWRLEVSSTTLAPVRELLLIDAHGGAISLHFNQVDAARDRMTYDGGGTVALPGTLRCTEAQNPAVCGAGDQDVIDAHNFAGDTYNFYNSIHGRDGVDGAGGTITSTVHWDDGVTCPNAFWDGTQMVYCDGLPAADDVVGHEMTHGVTESESGLFYYYQSGAINESLSDVWGELIDLGNGAGTDTAATRWLMGEDAPGLGAIRDMQTPGTFGHPDRMTSASYWIASGDTGGVHINSGINNKAAYLLVDGDTFNGQTVAAIGINKTARIYYEAQTNLLTSASDYADLYNILYQACLNLIGNFSINSSDCSQVRKATDATEMNLEPKGDPAFSPDAPLCPSGKQLKSPAVFADDFEVSPTGWGEGSLPPVGPPRPNQWFWFGSYANSGTGSLYSPNVGTTSDTVIQKNAAVPLPANAYLHFNHGYGFEASGGVNFDGGVVEYSTDGGSTWSDLSALFDTGRSYNGSISVVDGNPLAGRTAFVDESRGFVSSRYTLATLAAQNFQVRFRIATDSLIAGPLGWSIDDVMIYQCETAAPSCSGVDVLVQNRNFAIDQTCTASSSFSANTAVIIKSGATVVVQSPSTTLGPGFSVEAGATFMAVGFP